MKYDFHTHSKYSSDGVIEPKNLIKTAIKNNLSGIAVTDHNTILGGLKAKEFEAENFNVIVGSEIITERGEVIGLFLSEEIQSKAYLDVINEIKEQNGVVVLPHPFDDTRGNGINPNSCDAKLINYIEVFNSRCLRQKYNDKSMDYAQINHMKKIAGSDAHFPHEIGNAGVDIDTNDLYEAFHTGNFKIFYEKSSINYPLINLGLTKVLKTWRKRNFGLF